jgi:hypothetical protein
VFVNANKCRLFAAEGGEIMTDMHFIRELIQVFRDSGVFPQAIDEFEAKPLASKTIAALKTHFTDANRNRRKNNASLKGVLSANTAATNGALKSGTTNGNTDFKGWHYCWSHGVCDHTSTDCTKPATGHIKTATVNNLCGGCTFLQRPQGFEQVWKFQRDTEKEKASKDRKDREKKRKATAAKALEAAVEKALAARGHTDA